MATTTTMPTTASTRFGARKSADATRRARKARGTMMVTSATPTAGRRAGRAAVVARASEEAEDAFEAKLGALRGKRSKRAANDSTGAADEAGDAPRRSAATQQSRAKGVRDFTVTENVDEPAIDWGDETIVFEGPPARGEVVANVAMSWTLVWIPLAIQAVGRALWLKYKITDKRVTVISESPLRKERTDIPLDQIADVISVGRGIGAWGDMVVTLRNGEKVEIRSLPDFKKCEEMIREKMYKEKIIDF